MIKEVKALSSVLCIATHSSPACVCVGTHTCVPLSFCLLFYTGVVGSQVMLWESPTPSPMCPFVF